MVVWSHEGASVNRLKTLWGWIVIQSSLAQEELISPVPLCSRVISGGGANKHWQRCFRMQLDRRTTNQRYESLLIAHPTGNTLLWLAEMVSVLETTSTIDSTTDLYAKQTHFWSELELWLCQFGSSQPNGCGKWPETHCDHTEHKWEGTCPHLTTLWIGIRCRGGSKSRTGRQWKKKVTRMIAKWSGHEETKSSSLRLVQGSVHKPDS